MILSINDQITRPIYVEDFYGEYLKTVKVYCMYEFNPYLKNAKV